MSFLSCRGEITKMTLRIRSRTSSEKEKKHLARFNGRHPHQLRTPLTSANLILSLLEHNANENGEESNDTGNRGTVCTDGLADYLPVEIVTAGCGYCSVPERTDRYKHSDKRRASPVSDLSRTAQYHCADRCTGWSLHLWGFRLALGGTPKHPQELPRSTGDNGKIRDRLRGTTRCLRKYPFMTAAPAWIKMIYPSCLTDFTVGNMKTRPDMESDWRSAK